MKTKTKLPASQRAASERKKLKLKAFSQSDCSDCTSGAEPILFLLDIPNLLCDLPYG